MPQFPRYILETFLGNESLIVYIAKTFSFN